MSEAMSAEAVVERIIDVRTFWQAVGLRAVGTAIVTAEADDGPRGFLALSATHLCADPPMMMVSVDKKTSALQTMIDGGHFAINYLSTDQADLAGPSAARATSRARSASSWGRGPLWPPVRRCWRGRPEPSTAGSRK